MGQSIRNFFSEDEQLRIRQAIAEAEAVTSGEIRIHLEDYCRGDSPEARAAQLFEELKMHKTEKRNGVLIYLAVHDHRFAVIGDKGIHAYVDDEFWIKLRDRMSAEFSDGNFIEGILYSIEECGNILKGSFPYRHDDINELSDDISFGEE